MSTEPAPTKGQEKKSEEELMDTAALDKVIEEADPEFVNSLKEIGPIDTHVFDDQGISMAPTFSEFKEKWRGSKLKFIVLLLFPAVYSFYKIQHLGRIIKSTMIAIKENGIPFILEGLKGFFLRFKEHTHQMYLKYRKFDRKQKLIFNFAIALVIGLPFFIYRVATKGILPKEAELFMLSMEELAFKSYTYTVDQQESFYDSPRVPQNIFDLARMIVNIRRSENSSENPMLAVEFSLHGISSDVLIEIKDRETEFKDMFARTVEQFNFDELDSKEGKQRLINVLLSQVNQMTTVGKIKKVYIKNFVLKP